MFRQVSSFLTLLAVLATTAFAQSVPVATGDLPDQTGNTNGDAVSVGLTAHFTISGVSGDIMRFDTTFGRFDVEMLAEAAPNHVVNFQGYASRGDYDNTMIHRMNNLGGDVTAVVQGGGFTAEVPAQDIPTVGTVNLEYNVANARGTLAAARAADLNSANSQWYFNTVDNSETLGPDNNSGFTVFGRVMGNGMEVVDEMAAVPTYRFNAPFGEIPLVDYEITQDVTPDKYITINSVREVPLYPSGSSPDGALSFSATSSDESVVTAEISFSTLVLTPGARGTATVTVTATDIRGVSATQELEFTTAGIEITSQPSDVDAAAGSNAALTVVATADTALTYQWYRLRTGETTATAISGATSATLNLTNLATTDMGFYWVVISEGANQVSSRTAVVTLTGGTSRLSNLSTRGNIPANGTLTPGFVLRGAGSKELIIRAVGPTLADFDVVQFMPDPTMALVPQGSSDPIVTNDNWEDASNSDELATKSAAVGAFALQAGSKDAAVLTSVSLGDAASYTVQISSTDGSEGVVLAEVYDPDAIGSGVELSNISARGFSGPGADALVPGFVIDGTGAKTMLIRVIGPSLAGFGVSDVMADPRLEILPRGQQMAVVSNDNWGGTTELKAAFTAAGAFELEGDDSKDAAALVRLPPGAYTVRAQGADNTSGVILVEAYEVIE